MDWSFTSGKKCPLLLGFNWKSKNNCTYYFTTCYLMWILKPWNSAEHKELPYDTVVCHWCRWIYVGYLWYVCIHQQGSSVTIRRKCLGGTIPGITRISWEGWCRGSIKFWKFVDTYDQFVGDEIFLPGEQGIKIMARFAKRVDYNDGKSWGIEQPKLFIYHSLYEISFPNVRTEESKVNVIAENMLSQVNS